MPLSQAMAWVRSLHPEAPAFQRRPEYVGTFTEGVLAHVVLGGGGAVRGIAVQCGRDLLDIAAHPPCEDVVVALLRAAGEHSWQMRLIHVVDDDPVGDVLERLGFDVESRAIEMLWSPDAAAGP